MSHPFAEEKLWSHRVFVSYARVLANLGFPVLRFDYRGAGDSSGDTPDTSLESHLDDLASALGTLRSRVPAVERIGLVGLRFGASLAALLAERAVEIESLAPMRSAPLVLWEPILDGEAYFQELLRSNLATQLAVYGRVIENRDALLARIRAGERVNVDGYDLAADLLNSCGKPDLVTTERKRHAGPVLVMQIATAPSQRPKPELEALAAAYSHGQFSRVDEMPFWREIKAFYGDARSLGTDTTRWLEAIA